MEKLLLKLADQLDCLDEASLMHLWNKYATIAHSFEPTKEWERGTLVFCLIQAKHMKNRLFNYNLANRRGMPFPQKAAAQPAAAGANAAAGSAASVPPRKEAPVRRRKTPCAVLTFPEDE